MEKACYIISKEDFEAAIDSAVEKYLAKREEEKTDRLLTTPEAAKRLHVTRVTLYRWEKDGYLIPIRKGKTLRYRSSDIDKLMNN